MHNMHKHILDIVMLVTYEFYIDLLKSVCIMSIKYNIIIITQLASQSNNLVNEK